MTNTKNTKKIAKIVSIMMAALMLVGVIAFMPQLKAATTVASGTWGTCPWSINSDGLFVLGAGTGADIDKSAPWYSYRSNVKTVLISGPVVLPQDCTNLFAYMSSCTTFNGMSNLNTSNVKYFTNTFEGCAAATAIDVSGFNTSNVYDFQHMFMDCKSLTSINVSNFDTSNSAYMVCMFHNCEKLTSLNVSNFNTSKVTSFHMMFDGCKTLTSLNVNNFDTSSATSIYGMFNFCTNLTSIDVSHFNTSKVDSFDYLFSNCYALTSINVSNFDTAKATSMRGMFQKVTNVISLDVSNFDMTLVTKYMSNMFAGNPKLASLKIGPKVRFVAGAEVGYPDAPTTANFPGTTGKWKAQSTGIAYDPISMPGNVSETYVVDYGSTTPPASGYTVSGTSTSYGTAAMGNTTIKVMNGTTQVASTTVSGTGAQSYTLANIPNGTYTLEVSKANHVTRTYAITVNGGAVTQNAVIFLLGDVTMDGKINASDISRLYGHVQSKAPITDAYQLAIADVATNSKVNSSDISRLYAHVQTTNPLF